MRSTIPTLLAAPTSWRRWPQAAHRILPPVLRRGIHSSSQRHLCVSSTGSSDHRKPEKGSPAEAGNGSHAQVGVYVDAPPSSLGDPDRPLGGVIHEEQPQARLEGGHVAAATEPKGFRSVAGPPPRRRARRYYIPGIDVPLRSSAEGTKLGYEETGGFLAVPDHMVAMLATSLATAVPAKGAAAGGAKDAVSSGPSGGDVSVGNSPDDALAMPPALAQGQMESNKKLKKLLIAALGADFAKAGAHNDGVRTSFSVVNYQTLRQQTGLKRIPSKLLLSCMSSPTHSFDWIDITAHPTATLTEYHDAVHEVLLQLGIHQTMVEDITVPLLLPQATVAQECYTLLLRYAIESPSSGRLDSFQDLTNRFTFSMTKNRVITVHRTPCTFVEELKKEWAAVLAKDRGPVFLLYYFVRETVATFASAISHIIVEFDKYEAGLFTTRGRSSSLAREVYHIKRRASVYGRTLTLIGDAYAHIASSLNIHSSDVHYQELQQDLTHVSSLAEELNANADSVLQLLFQLSSYQVNELMRVLTMFSAFFIPLSFIASVFGMNFVNLPMASWPNGEYYSFALMAVVATAIFLWFKAKHFI